MWSATDVEPHCIVMFCDQLELHSADDIMVTWLRDTAMKTLVKY